MKKLIMSCLAFLMLLSGCGSQHSHISTDEIDIDFTKMSSTIMFSTLTRMVEDPDPYIGQKVKMYAMFYVYPDEVDGGQYVECFLSDTTQCCSQALEVRLENEDKYNLSTMEEGTNAMVIGTFDKYTDDDFVYCMLTHAKLLDEKP